MRSEGEPRTDCERDERDQHERRAHRAADDAHQHEAVLTPKGIEAEFGAGSQRNEGQGAGRDEAQYLQLIEPDQPEPRRPRDEADEDVADDARQSDALRDRTADVRRDQDETERQCRARLDRNLCTGRAGESL